MYIIHISPCVCTQHDKWYFIICLKLIASFTGFSIMQYIYIFNFNRKTNNNRTLAYAQAQAQAHKRYFQKQFQIFCRIYCCCWWRCCCCFCLFIYFILSLCHSFYSILFFTQRSNLALIIHMHQAFSPQNYGK